MNRTFKSKSCRILLALEDRKLRHKVLHIIEKFVQILHAVEKVEMPYYKNILLFTKNGIAHNIRAMPIEDPFIKRLLLSTLATEYKERLRSRGISKVSAKQMAKWEKDSDEGYLYNPEWERK